MVPGSNLQALSRLVPVWVPEPALGWLTATALATLAAFRRYSPARLA